MFRKEQIRGYTNNYGFQKLWPATREDLPVKNFIYVTSYITPQGYYNMDVIREFDSEELLANDLTKNIQNQF